jgi:enoyl-[acyl-carrier protein] reductase II
LVIVEELMMKNINEILHIKYPIIQGGLAIVSDAKLASAVSNAGGAGIIGAGGHDADWMEEQINLAREMTDKPVGVNIVLMAEDKDEIIDIVCEKKPDFVTFGAGNPVPYIERFQELGILVIPVVPSLRLAKKVEAAGADALIIEGLEAGGHIGKQTTMALMSNVIENVDIPVIVAGGISDRRGIMAAMVMGASGVQMGSRFLVSEECPAHINVKKRIVESTDTDSVILGYTINHSVRVLKNKFADSYLGIEYSDEPRELLKGKMRGIYAKAVVEGDVENGMIQVGQSLDVLNEILSCNEIIKRLFPDKE